MGSLIPISSPGGGDAAGSGDSINVGVGVGIGEESARGDEEARPYVAPRTPIERQLADMFEELLDLERVSVADTFFGLAGFSLLATQLAARIYEAFQIELSLRDLFEHPTIEDLAQRILVSRAQLAGDGELSALLADIELNEFDR